jgi:hypothetical protein
MDMQIILDSSGSVGSDNFQTMLNEVADNLIPEFQFGYDKTKIAILRYASSSTEILNLDSLYKEGSIQNTVRNIPYVRGGTNTGDALNQALVTFKQHQRTNSNVAKVCLVFTDGSSSDDVVGPTGKWASAGIKVFAIGIGSGISFEGLVQTAGDKSRVIQASTFKQIGAKIKDLLEEICVTISACTSDPCANGGSCHDVSSSFRCDCAHGFTGSQCKSDINECLSENGGCSQNCLNSFGSYRCSCRVGYHSNDGGKTCIDINECLIGNGGCSHNCLNSAGSYGCSCRSGYHSNDGGKTCIDINECLIGNGGCSHNCLNSAGSYRCSCRSNYHSNDGGKTCIGINECLIENGGCSHNCLNTADSYRCTCRSGYRSDDGGKTCYDINECLEVSKGGCEHGCSNTLGSFFCTCKLGYELNMNRKTCNLKCTRHGELIEHPENCYQFLYCLWPHTKLFRVSVETCAKPLFFNPAIDVCDYPSKVNCKNKSVLSGISKVTEISFNAKKCPKDKKYLAHETDCNKFLTCLYQGTEDAQVVTSSCPDGKHFNAKLSVCDWPENSDCGVVLAKAGCTYVGELLPHSTDCEKYVQCLSANPTLEEILTRDCPGGTHFNKLAGFCDWPENAKCTTA